MTDPNWSGDDVTEGSSEDLEQVLAEMGGEIVATRRLSVAAYAQQLRAEADAILAAHGVQIKADIAHRLSEVEAA